MNEFCTCKDHACPFHPSQHEQGCTLCVQKNLAAREIPSCFFHLLEKTYTGKEYSFLDFARAVLNDR